ncbi:MAG: endoribonuclease MazF [Dehalococcoidia bacterium]|nr:endoribonuclease MazF [Dehalococcoidia bacterium]
MVTLAYTPERGDIVWLNFSPQAGHEQAGRRPALVLSPLEYNDKTGLALLCPITSRSKGYPFEVSLPSPYQVTGVVLADQLRNLDWRVRNARFECYAPHDVLASVLRMIESLLH